MLKPRLALALAGSIRIAEAGWQSDSNCVVRVNYSGLVCMCR